MPTFRMNASSLSSRVVESTMAALSTETSGIKHSFTPSNKAGELNLQLNLQVSGNLEATRYMPDAIMCRSADHHLSSHNENKCPDVNDAPRDPET